MIKYIPNILSLSRVIWTIIFYTLIMTRPLVEVWVLLLLFILIESSDLLDGMVARACKSTSDIGKFLDPVCDVTAHFICLFALYTLYMVPAVVIIIFIIREIWVTFLRALLLQRNIVLAARWSGKLKTWFYAIGILMSILLLPQSLLVNEFPKLSTRLLTYLPILYYIGAAFSIISALAYVVKVLRLT